jgi:hypothetical protein
MIIETTPQQIVEQYSACMDSVNLINTLKAKSSLTVEENDMIKRNQEHLNIMLAKDYWTTEDMTPIEAATTI